LCRLADCALQRVGWDALSPIISTIVEIIFDAGGSSNYAISMKLEDAAEQLEALGKPDATQKSTEFLCELGTKDFPSAACRKSSGSPAQRFPIISTVLSRLASSRRSVK